MKKAYEDLYNKLNSSQILANAQKIEEKIIEIEEYAKSLTTQISSSKWTEMGLSSIKENTIPNIQSKIRTLTENILTTKNSVCIPLINNLLPKLKELKDLEQKYNSLEADDENKTNIGNQISKKENEIDSTLSTIKGVTIREKDSTSNTILNGISSEKSSDLKSNINSTFSNLKSSLQGLKSLSEGDGLLSSNNILLSGTSVSAIVNGKKIVMDKAEVEAARKNFIGNQKTGELLNSSK